MLPVTRSRYYVKCSCADIPCFAAGSEFRDIADLIKATVADLVVLYFTAQLLLLLLLLLLFQLLHAGSMYTVRTGIIYIVVVI